MIDLSKPIRVKANSVQCAPLATAKLLGLDDGGWIKFRFDGSPPSHQYSAIRAPAFYQNFENYEPEGTISDVQVFDRALSAAEVESMHKPVAQPVTVHSAGFMVDENGEEIRVQSDAVDDGEAIVVSNGSSQPVGDCVGHSVVDFGFHGCIEQVDKVHLKRRVIEPHPDRVFLNKPMRMKSTHADVTVTSIFRGMVEFDWQIANSSSLGAATMDEFVRLIENYEPFEPSIKQELDSVSLPPQTPLEQVDDFIKFATEKFVRHTFHFDNDHPLDLEYVGNRMMRKEDFSSGVLAGWTNVWNLCKHAYIRCLRDQEGALKVYLSHERQVESRYRLRTALDLECALYLFDDKKKWLLRKPVDDSQLTAGDGLAYEVDEPLQFDSSKLTVKADGETIKLGPDGELKPLLTSVDLAKPIRAKCDHNALFDYLGLTNETFIKVRLKGCSDEKPLLYTAESFERQFENVPEDALTAAKPSDDQLDYLARKTDWLKNELDRMAKRTKTIIPAESDWPNKVWISLPVEDEVAGRPRQLGSFRVDKIVGVIDAGNSESGTPKCRLQMEHHDVIVYLSRNSLIGRLIDITKQCDVTGHSPGLQDATGSSDTAPAV